MKKLDFPKPIITAVLINLAICLLIILLNSKIPPMVPLFYGQPQSEKQLAGKLFLVLPSFISLFFAILNFIIIKTTKDEFIQKVFLGTTLATTILSTITVLKIILLVGNL